MKKNKELSQKETVDKTEDLKDEKLLKTPDSDEQEVSSIVEENIEPKKKDKKSKKDKKKAREQELEEVKPKKGKKEKKSKKAKKEKIPKKIKDRTVWFKKYFNKYAGKQDKAYTKFVEQDMKAAIMRAHKLSSIDAKAYKQPIIISIPDAFYNSSKVSFRLDRKADGTVTQIYDQALMTILFFGESTLYYYQANVDHRNGHIAFDTAGEFNLFDIVHLETQLKYDHPEKHKYIMLDLQVGLSDGRTIPFHLRNHRLHNEYSLPEILTDQEQQILDLFKSRVRKEKTL